MTAAGRLFVCVSMGIAAAAQQPTFRSGVEYVQIDAVVTDKDGHSAGGLTQNDFEIVERGKPQTITTFQFITVPATRRTVADVKMAAPSIDVASNVHGPEGRQWALVIDDFHIIELHILQTKKVVLAFLESLPAGDQVAIVFVGRSDLSQDFTSDLGAQIRTVNRIKDSLGFAYDAADRGGGDAVARVSAADRHRYGIGTTDVLKNVAAALGRSTYSRKAIAYVSEGITYPLVAVPAADPLEGSYISDIIDRWHEALELARKAGVPIYAIDPRGIPDCTAVRAGCGGGPPRETIQNQQDHMRELSENTGGRAFVGYADTEQAVRELVDDNNSFYLLGYYPDRLERDGKFHGVDVKVKGRSDLDVSYVINAPIDLPPQPLTVRVAVASQALDRVASIHVPVEVMNPTRDQLQIGSIVLGFAGAPRQTAVPANALKGLVPIQPTLVRAFRPSDTLQIHAPLFWRGMDGATAIVTIAVTRENAAVRTTRATVAGSPGTSRAVSRAQQAPVTGSLSLGGLAPGYYSLEIEARLMTGSVTRRAVAFEVTP